jgi:hypothetical protein
VQVSSHRLHQLIEELRARGSDAGIAALRGAWDAAGSAWVELEETCWQQLTQTCQALGIALPPDLLARPARGRYYRGCRG